MTNKFDFTERLFRDAGITPGMNVLDIGCGTGQVSFLVAELLDGSGQVTGIDIDKKSISMASAQAEELGHTNIHFMQLDLGELNADADFFETEFDAIVARRVFMYLPKPQEIIGKLSKLLKPNGLMVIQESDSTMVPKGLTSMPLHDKVVKWMWDTVKREGADVHMGFNLPSILSNAGLVVDYIRAEPVIQGYGTHYPLHFIVRAMLTRMVRHGVATEEEIDIETLEQRLQDERGDSTVYISDMAFGIWGHKPLVNEHAP